MKLPTEAGPLYQLIYSLNTVDLSTKEWKKNDGCHFQKTSLSFMQWFRWRIIIEIPFPCSREQSYCMEVSFSSIIASINLLWNGAKWLTWLKISQSNCDVCQLSGILSRMLSSTFYTFVIPGMWLLSSSFFSRNLPIGTGANIYREAVVWQKNLCWRGLVF